MKQILLAATLALIAMASSPFAARLPLKPGCKEWGIRGIQQGYKNLPTTVHQPGADEEFVRMILVKPSLGVGQASGALGH
jgi:hypothetical protein